MSVLLLMVSGWFPEWRQLPDQGPIWVNLVARAALSSLGEAMSRRLILTEHAKAEMLRRGISEATALDVANTPEQRLPARPGREIRQSRVIDPASGKLQLIRVVVEHVGDADTVVTVYRTSKVHKYWRDE